MKKFVFTLQAVENLALSTEKQQKIRIRQLENLLAQLNRELDDLKDAYLTAKERCAEKMKTGLTSDELAQYSAYYERLIHAMVQTKEKIIRTMAERDRWIQKRIETRRELKTLERLRETQYEEYLQEAKQEAEKEIGDMVSFNVASK